MDEYDELPKPSTSSMASVNPQGPPAIKRRRRTTKREQAILEDLYNESRTPSLEARQRVCELVDMPMKKLQVWLQNRRQKEKKDAGKWKPSYSTTDASFETTTTTTSSTPAKAPSHTSSSASSPSLVRPAVSIIGARSPSSLLSPEDSNPITLPPIRDPSPALSIASNSTAARKVQAKPTLPSLSESLLRPPASAGLARSISLPLPFLHLDGLPSSSSAKKFGNSSSAFSASPTSITPALPATLSQSANALPAPTSSSATFGRTISEPAGRLLALNVVKDGRTMFNGTPAHSQASSRCVSPQPLSPSPWSIPTSAPLPAVSSTASSLSVVGTNVLSPVSAAVLARRQIRSASASVLSFNKADLQPRSGNAPAAAGVKSKEAVTQEVTTPLWDRLDSDPFEDSVVIAEDDDDDGDASGDASRFVLSEAARKQASRAPSVGSIRMEDVLTPASAAFLTAARPNESGRSSALLTRRHSAQPALAASFSKMVSSSAPASASSLAPVARPAQLARSLTAPSFNATLAKLSSSDNKDTSSDAEGKQGDSLSVARTHVQSMRTTASLNGRKRKPSLDLAQSMRRSHSMDILLNDASKDGSPSAAEATPLFQFETIKKARRASAASTRDEDEGDAAHDVGNDSSMTSTTSGAPDLTFSTIASDGAVEPFDPEESFEFATEAGSDAESEVSTSSRGSRSQASSTTSFYLSQPQAGVAAFVRDGTSEKTTGAKEQKRKTKVMQRVRSAPLPSSSSFLQQEQQKRKPLGLLSSRSFSSSVNARGGPLSPSRNGGNIHHVIGSPERRAMGVQKAKGEVNGQKQDLSKMERDCAAVLLAFGK